MAPKLGDDHTCSGPVHGRDALPKGYRAWQPGQTLSIVQHAEGHKSHNVFCSIECFCDWHGHFEAAIQGADDPDAEIPGEFILMWISPHGSSCMKFDTWVALTEYVGRYSATLIEKGIW